MMTTQHDYVPTPTEDDEDVANRWGSWAGTPVATERKAPEVGVRVTEKKDGGGESMAKIRAALTWTPRTGENGGWKPLSMSMPILSALLLFTLLLIAAIELLAQESQKKGGLALSPTLADIPQVAMISYQYAPQVVAVVYSLIWAWVDLDVKRMHPWFELSKPEGALAKDSLLLDYPYTFIASVPFIAAKRKHWLVFLSGTAMLVVFWALTPLQTSQMGTGLVRFSKEREVKTRSILMPIKDQMESINSRFLLDGYAVGWLNQSFPSFMTDNSAYMPFYLDESRAETNPPTNWTASTTQLYTELDCSPANITITSSVVAGTHSFHDNTGCNATLTLPISGKTHAMKYIGYWSSPYSEDSLAGPDCTFTEERLHSFLAIWSRTYEATSTSSSDLPRFDITALYCQPSYYKQNVTVSVRADSLDLDESSVQPVGEREPLSTSEFNSTTFEWLLAHGMPPEMKDRDFPESFVIEQHAQLGGYNLSAPISNMIGYALAGKNHTTEEYSDPKLFHQVLEEAHKYLFSLAIDKLLVNQTNFANRTAVTTYPMRGIIVSRDISAALEALLGFTAIMIILIMWFSYRASSYLHVNPSSVSRIADILRDSPQFLDFFCSVDNADESSLLEATKGHRFRLVWSELRNSPEMLIDLSSDKSEDQKAVVGLERGYYEPTKPAALRSWSAILFITSVAGVIGGLAYLKWAEKTYNGLRRPSQNFEVQQILESYIPAIIATLIEPFWILVTRLLCVLQPFKDLWKGNVGSLPSIDSTYASIPPQFIAWRAFKSSHFVLALVCGAVFFANILTVSLPAIFETNEVTVSYPTSFRPEVNATFSDRSLIDFNAWLGLARIRSGSYHDNAYATMANISSGTSLPPWVSSNWYFQPFQQIEANSKKPAGSYNLTTRGFGVNANCTAVGKKTFPVEKRSGPLNQTDCMDSVLNAQDAMRENINSRPSGVAAMEFVGRQEYGENLPCGRQLLIGWARTNESENINGTIEGSFLMCNPIFETALFDVEVDDEGYVLDYHMKGTIESSLGYEESKNQTTWIIRRLNQILYARSTQWHNDTLSRDWINHLYLLGNDSRTLLDAWAPVPDPKEVLPAIEDLYRRLFTVLLGLNTRVFERADEKEIIQGWRMVTEVRLFLTLPAYIISTALLALNIGFAIVLYTSGIIFVLPRMPTTIGSIVAYIAPSNMMTEDQGEETRTFSFGRYMGRDGQAHIGVDLASRVVPIDPAFLAGKPRRRKIRLLGGKGQDSQLASQGNTWL